MSCPSFFLCFEWLELGKSKGWLRLLWLGLFWLGFVEFGLVGFDLVGVGWVGVGWVCLGWGWLGCVCFSQRDTSPGACHTRIIPREKTNTKTV